MIPRPNLDDRTYKDIVEEAIRLIPHYCPDWTNHNPTDPGITLIELFAWMVEMVIYRLNKVPENNYLALLDLIGLSLTPPQSSKALLTFFPIDKYDGEVIIKRGTQVSTRKSELADAIVFETEKELTAANISLESCISTQDGLVTDNFNSSARIEEDGEGFSIFSGKEEIKRYIYLSDPTIAFLGENNSLNISFINSNEIKSSGDEIVNFLVWEYWNGKKWTSIEYSRSLPGVKRKDNEIYFSGPIDIDITEVENREGYFIRASLISIPEREKCFELNDVRLSLFFHGEGLNPDVCLSNSDNMVFDTIDLNKEFSPFIGIPKYNDAFYIASNEIFSKENSDIDISYQLSDANTINSPEPSDDFMLKYEYWNGRNWIELGLTSIKGVTNPEGEFNFIDTTNGLTNTGKVRFTRPEDIKETEINGLLQYWIRIRITAGDFGTGGKYKLNEQGKWEWIFDKPVKPSVISQIKLRYLAEKKPVERLMSYYDFSFFDFTKKNNDNYWLSRDEEEDAIKYIRIFNINKEKCPITYFGFNKRLPSGNFGIYFKINERKKAGPGKISAGSWRHEHDVKKIRRPISIKWEYWDGDNWIILSVNDYTDNFHESGFVEFNSPEDIQRKMEFGKDQFWIRLVFESGSFEIDPKIHDIILNSVYAFNQQTHINETLGSSNSGPSQEFYFLHEPVLPGVDIMARENEPPPADERKMIIEEEGENAILIKKNADGRDEIWIRYHQVENFYASDSKSRHYCIDYTQNKIIFGNGANGIIPPGMKNNIKAVKYKTGGGRTGNVGSGTISLLRENIPYIAKVNNHYPTEGGADLEDIENLKSRASNVFKNLNRAVTAEDYEWLAREASSSVARAKCLSKCGKDGAVTVIILPEPDSSNIHLEKKMYPTSELLRRVREYLNARKLVGAKLKVEAPVYINISINLSLVFKKEISEIQIIKKQVELAVRRYLHYITGGPRGDGWPFGMPLTKNDIFSILEKIEGIYYIEEIGIINDDSEVLVDKLILDEDNQIHVNNIYVSERKYQF